MSEGVVMITTNGVCCFTHRVDSVKAPKVRRSDAV